MRKGQEIQLVPFFIEEMLVKGLGNLLMDRSDFFCRLEVWGLGLLLGRKAADSESEAWNEG